MNTLLLMRHAKSSWADPGMQDHERPLNKRGLRDAPRMGDWLKQQGLLPDLILCSSAVRAQQTGEAVAKCLGQKIEVVDDLYLASVGTWRKVLSAHLDNESILGIGHNPGLEEFVSEVAGNYEQIPTAAIAWFKVQENADLSEKLLNKLSLQTVWRPKEVIR